ncbi:MAG: hypothetical protein R3A44_23510 [Caldilineaceae bacterium]
MMDFAYIGRLVALLIVLYVISMAFSYAQSFIMATVSMESPTICARRST